MFIARRQNTASILLTCFLAVFTPPASRAQAASGADADAGWEQVETALGRTGKLQPGDVYKFGMPRSDMHVTVDGTVTCSQNSPACSSCTSGRMMMR